MYTIFSCRLNASETAANITTFQHIPGNHTAKPRRLKSIEPYFANREFPKNEKYDTETPSFDPFTNTPWDNRVDRYTPEIIDNSVDDNSNSEAINSSVEIFLRLKLFCSILLYYMFASR